MEKLNKFQKIINKIYYNIFIERNKKKIDFNFEQNFYRWDLIDYLNKKHNFTSYLEIGCDDDALFSKIKIDKKIGIDPVSGGNLKIKSDDFFQTNKENFDCIFIDGLHEYDQVKRDIKNSIKFLNYNGFILVHDCLPDQMSKQAVPRYRLLWNGDVWKAIVEFRCLDDIEIYTCKVDQGIAIIQKKKNSDKLMLNKKIKDLKFRDFYENHQRYMRTINLTEFKTLF